MTGFVQIDLSRLPPPDVIETIDYEVILASCKADVVARLATFDPALATEVQAILALESEVATKVLEAAAYREVLLRARVNDAVRAILLAYSIGSDLDHKGADFETPRMVVTPATGDTPAVMENDERYRRRLQLAPEAFSTAGARGAYIFHALSVSTAIADAWAFSPSDGRVDVVLAGLSGAAVSDTLLAAVSTTLLAEKVRPLTDNVVVRRATRKDYSLTLTARIKNGPDRNVIKTEIERSVRAYAARRYLIGEEVWADGITGAAMVAGVEHITGAIADVICADHEIAYLAGLTVTVDYA